ncbi:MAG: peptidylprolyl isomerase [Sulfuricurvum sp.]|jgi:hypothetical protein|uniref:peptidylprolyl isomerase n=1 Tax=Sulfuricurvum sp. TaxID=2025608 RepID=UPI0025D72B41|nr:peptidylprolyl isomerase [Sulfuricurvum sp.]MCK9374062.1 peptidylprolyl isomerase [Sulfuricurvum sp.]
MRLFTLSTILASLLWSAPIGGVSILVKNSPITLYEVQQEMKQSNTDAQQSADTLIRKKLEQLEAIDKKITVTPAEVDEELEKMATQNNLSKEQFLNAMLTVRGLDEKGLKKKIEENLRGQKLYSTIAFSKMGQPGADEEAEYYHLHLDDFSKPESFAVTTYSASTKEALQAKISDPMYNISGVDSKEETITYDSINPQLVQILNKTPQGNFTPIFPNGANGFMSFYLREKNNIVTENLDAVRPQITNAIMGEKRNQVLNDHFTRLRLSADIKVIRLPL